MGTVLSPEPVYVKRHWGGLVKGTCYSIHCDMITKEQLRDLLELLSKEIE